MKTRVMTSDLMRALMELDLSRGLFLQPTAAGRFASALMASGDGRNGNDGKNDVPVAGRPLAGVMQFDDGRGGLRSYDRVGGFGLIQAGGVIWKGFARSAGWVPNGVLDLDALDVALFDVARDPEIEVLVLDLDTPGGYGLGLHETASLVRAVSRSGKVVVSYTDMVMCSAGYWIGAAADSVFAAPSAIVGSIGSYLTFYDYSKMFEEFGVEAVVTRSADLKGIGVPGKPVTDVEREFLRDNVGRHAAKFTGFVKAQRGEVDEDSMRGQWFSGEEALERNLVDGLAASVGDLVGELAELSEG